MRLVSLAQLCPPFVIPESDDAVTTTVYFGIQQTDAPRGILILVQNITA